jgi:hypothetical protein
MSLDTRTQLSIIPALRPGTLSLQLTNAQLPSLPRRHTCSSNANVSLLPLTFGQEEHKPVTLWFGILHQLSNLCELFFTQVHVACSKIFRQSLC